MIDCSSCSSPRTWLPIKLKIKNFVFFSCIFLATKKAKTHTKPWSNSAILTQSTNKIQTMVIRSKTQNQKYLNPKLILINKIHQNTRQSSSILGLIRSKHSDPPSHYRFGLREREREREREISVSHGSLAVDLEKMIGHGRRGRELRFEIREEREELGL